MNSYSFPVDPEPVAHDQYGAPIYEWATGHEPDDPADDCMHCLIAEHGVCTHHHLEGAEDGAVDEAQARREES